MFICKTSSINTKTRFDLKSFICPNSSFNTRTLSTSPTMTNPAVNFSLILRSFSKQSVGIIMFNVTITLQNNPIATRYGSTRIDNCVKRSDICLDECK